MNSKSNVVSLRSNLSIVPVKPARTVNGKPLTEAQNRARDLRNEKLVAKRAAKKSMMAKLPEFGTVVPSDGAFVPEAVQAGVELTDIVTDFGDELIQPIAVFGTVIEEKVIAEDLEEQCSTEQLRAYAAQPIEAVGPMIFIPTAPKSKPSPARKTDRRWGIDDASKNANAMFRHLRKAGLVCGDSGTDPALAIAKAAAEGKLGAVTATTRRSEWTHEFQLTTNAPTVVSAVLADLGYDFSFDEATSTFNVAR